MIEAAVVAGTTDRICALQRSVRRAPSEGNRLFADLRQCMLTGEPARQPHISMYCYRISKRKKKPVMHHRILSLFSILMVAACASTAPLSQPERTRSFDADRDSTFDAVLDAVGAQGYTYDSIDRPSGIMTTDKKSVGNLGPLPSGVTREIQARIQPSSGDPSTSEVTLTITNYRQSGAQRVAFGLSEEKRRELYAEWFDRIQNQLSR